jgi:predicted permease
MANFLNVWLVVLPVALIVACGYFWGKFRFPFHTGTVSDLILYVGSPCLIFSVISQRQILWKEYGLVMAAAFLVMLGTGAFVYIFLRFMDKPRLKGFYIPVMLMNTGNVGFPIALFAFGQEGFSRAIVYDFALLLVMYSLGVAILAGRKHFLDGLKLPALYAAAISLLVAYLKWPVPVPLLQTAVLLGNITIPLMLLLLGYRLSSTVVSSWGLPMIGALIRFAGGLLLAWLFVTFFPVSDINRKIILLYSALPSAMMSYVLTEKYHRDEALAASTVVISTFSSLVLIPLLLYFI